MSAGAPSHAGRNLLFGLLTFSYPLAIWLLGDRVEPRWLALSLVLLGALRLAASGQRLWIALALGAFALAAVSGVLNVGWPLRWYPVFVNGALLTLFAVTLKKGPPMAERLARMREKELPPHAIEYTRKVTIAWCFFFVVNGSIAAATTLFGTDQQWALYNGGLAYVAMGIFAGAEFFIRMRVRKAHESKSPSPPGERVGVRVNP